MKRRRAAILLLGGIVPGRGEEAALKPAVTASLKPGELRGSAAWPAAVQRLIGTALALTSRKLTYRYGSSDPALGGMDCSGTVFRVLTDAGVRDVPRQSDAMKSWVAASGKLTETPGTPALGDAVFAGLRPGDLLFWSGTWDAGRGAGAVSHVMLYLGRRQDGRPVMFGASDGRPYEGKPQCGVSVFDFRMPAAGGKARFMGYGPVPGLAIEGLKPEPPSGP